MIFFNKHFTPVFLFSLAISLNCFAANDAVPVMLRVAKAKQEMSRGYNFVTRLNELVYNEILEGKAILWDSPSKDIRLTGSSLQEIEKTSETSFKEQPIIFIYEKWTKASTEIQTTTLGFSFINKTNKGEDVAYGYVEFNDISEALLKSTLVVNADGNCNTNAGYVLQGKQFDFSIVQFNGESVGNEAASEKIKKEFVMGLGFNTLLFPMQRQVKCINYVLEPPLTIEDAPSKLTEEILIAVQNFLREHPVTFSDWGGSLLKDINATEDIKITKIEAEEVWSKHAGNIATQLKQLVIYIQGQSLDAITADDLANTEIICNSRELTTIFKEKKMLYYISRINDQKIERIDTFQFLNALTQTDWNALNLYVDNK